MVHKEPPTTIIEQCAVEQTGPNEWTSKWLGQRMGNPLPIAYGGCTLGVGVRAAFETVPETHNVYSIMGHYHGPASTEIPLTIIVHKTRDTKTFATRRVEVKQLQADGKTTRVVVEMLMDFHVDEPAAIPDWSPKPTLEYKSWEEQPETIDAGDDPKLAKAAEVMFALNRRYFETRACREGIAAQNLWGLLKNKPHTQDDRDLSSRVSAEWMKCREPLAGSRGDRAAALVFVMDAALSFTPLTHSHKWFEDVGPCSSLDFALRIMVPEVDLSKEWHLRERTAISGSGGRTFAEGRLWDGKGQLVASMTQQSIMRAKPVSKAKGSKL